jgi:hypothetical protein
MRAKYVLVPCFYGQLSSISPHRARDIASLLYHSVAEELFHSIISGKYQLQTRTLTSQKPSLSRNGACDYH